MYVSGPGDTNVRASRKENASMMTQIERSGYTQRSISSFVCLLLTLLLSACSTGGGTQTDVRPTTPANRPVQTPPGPAIACTAHSSNPVTLTMYYGSEKQSWMDDVVTDFNSRAIAACDGPITVKAIATGSGSSTQQIVDGSIQPDVWSPAGSIWLTIANAEWKAKNGNDLITTGANDAPSLVSSPVVIAMWKTQAEALGWPNKPIGWSDITKLSTDARGWAAYGHPEFGAFKFGHTHPDYSNSGLDAVIAMNYAASGKVRGLTTGDVNNAATKDFVSKVESSVIHYGDSTGFFADKMFSNGPGYLSATVMYESLVVEANNGKKYPKLPLSVVSIYPKEGTFYSDHPFVIPQGTWVTAAKRSSALAFRNFLLDQPQQVKALQYGFRPASSTIAIGAPLDTAHGVDPTQPKTLLQLPPSDVVNAIRASWQEQRRKVDVMLVLDRSGSMGASIGGIKKIDGAKQGLKEFITLLGDGDTLGLTIFSNTSIEVSPTTQLGPKRQELLGRVDGIIPDGSTLLFDTIAQRVSALQKQPSRNIKAVVVLTDGEDTASTLTLDQLIGKITASGEDAGNGVKVFTIAYGGEANASELGKIANVTGGKPYVGTPQNIKQVYEQISEFF